MFGVAGGEPRPDPSFGTTREVSALAVGDAGVWAVAERHAIVRRDPEGAWTEVARSELELVCAVATSQGVFVGTEEAHLLRLGDDGALAPVEAFETIEGRETWFTPWGGPPAVRSIAQDLSGRLHANVHVGGIPRSVDAGASWEPTIDIDADIHQVVAHPSEPDVVLAAGAVGLAVSVDGGASWRIEREGLHATYARAVAVAGDHVLLTVSNGPRGGRAAIYRTTARAGVRVRALHRRAAGVVRQQHRLGLARRPWWRGRVRHGRRRGLPLGRRRRTVDARGHRPPVDPRGAVRLSGRSRATSHATGSGRTPSPAPPNRSRCAGFPGRRTRRSVGARRGSSCSRSSAGACAA